MSEITRLTIVPLAVQRSAAPTEQSKSSLTEISRKWLADIDPGHVSEFHAYLTFIRLARHMRKIGVCRVSQSDGTAASGVSLPTISQTERRSYVEPGCRTMVRLARGYGIPLSNLQHYFD